ncbi:MAG: tRNA (guanosine(46)-N7)-methyltransferase TrmB [Planctomycetota bacterium]
MPKSLPPLSAMIERFVVPYLERPWPLDPEALFGRRAPLTLEIGFGNGAFLADQALRHPERDHLGIEIAWGSVDFLLRRAWREDLHNLRILRLDARFVLESLLPANAFERVWVNHPDPWPKERHHGRRLIQRPFLEALQAVMAPGARLTIATDHADYAVWIGRELEAQPWFVSELETTEVPELPDHVVTKYQRKAREQGIGNHFFVWKKIAPDAPARPRQEVPPVPNVTFDGAYGDADLLAGFEPNRIVELHEGVEVVVGMERAWRAADGGSWMVECLVKEGAHSQQVGLIVVRGEKGRLAVKTSSIGHPRGTWGVKRAVRRLASIIAARNPELALVSSNVGDIGT